MSDSFDSQSISFSQWDLDRRITEAIEVMPNITAPTPVQRELIPVALQGRHILASAPTGSGKTLAYCIPVIQKLLTIAGDDECPSLQALIMVPSLDLCAQVHNVVKTLIRNCADVITVDHLEKSRFNSIKLPSLLISTPTTLLDFLKTRDLGEKFRQQLKFVVLDEADSLVAFEQDTVMQELVGSYFPSSSSQAYQAILCSATLDVFVSSLRGLMLHRPEVLEVKGGGAAANLKELYVPCEEKDKHLLIYSLLTLQVIKGKTLIFTSSTERAYGLQLFLERFNIAAAVLNAELPLSSRMNVLEQFNQSVFQLLIATDASSDATAQAAADDLKIEERFKTEEDSSSDDEDDDEEASEDDEEEDDEEAAADSDDDEDVEEDEDAEDDSDDESIDAEFLAAAEAGLATLSDDEEEARQGLTRGVKKELEAQFSSNRGLDIQGVEVVINFDMPQTVKAYTHRVGRTARGNNKGIALSLLTKDDTGVFATVMQLRRTEARKEPEQMAITVKALEGFRYRVNDVLRAVTRKSIAALRARELQHEAMHNERLREHFKANTADLMALKKTARALKTGNAHFRNVDSLPSYLVPATLRGQSSAVQQAIQAQVGHDSMSGLGTSALKRSAARRDPLRNLEANSSADTLRKRRKLVTTEYMLKKDAKIDYDETAPEDLPPLARNKIWKIQHGKKIKKADKYRMNKRKGQKSKQHKVGPRAK